VTEKPSQADVLIKEGEKRGIMREWGENKAKSRGCHLSQEGWEADGSVSF